MKFKVKFQLLHIIANNAEALVWCDVGSKTAVCILSCCPHPAACEKKSVVKATEKNQI